MSKNIFITDALQYPFDEGMRKFAYEMYLFIKKHYDNFEIISINCNDRIKDERIIRLKCNKLLLNIKLISVLKKSKGTIFYLPLASLTFNSFIRGNLINFFSKKSNVVMIGLQVRSYNHIQRILISLLNRIFIAVQSEHMKETISMIDACRIYKIGSGVDLEKFHPIHSINEIIKLKIKYGLPIDKKIILHVGHISKGRNILKLAELQKCVPKAQIVVVGSSSTEQDREVKDVLEKSGVKVICEYIENIEELYQISDLYIFPVLSSTSSIEVPLSIIEALACGIPVISTINAFSTNPPGMYILNSLSNFPNMVNDILSLPTDKNAIAKGVELRSWYAVLEEFISVMLDKSNN